MLEYAKKNNLELPEDLLSPTLYTYVKKEEKWLDYISKISSKKNQKV